MLEERIEPAESIDEIISYDKFRTGLNFREVYFMLKYEQKRKHHRGEYMFITRHTILGRWHQLKKKVTENT